MKTKKIFGGKWLRVTDSLVDYDVARKVPSYWRIPGFRVRGNKAPFGGSWRIKGNEIVLIDVPTAAKGEHFKWGGLFLAFALLSLPAIANAQKTCAVISATSQNCVVTLTWTVTGVDATHPAPTSFQLRRGDGGAAKVVIGTVNAPTMLLQNTFTDGGNVAHCWDAIGILGTESSAASTQACWTSPTIPSLVPATPGGFTVSSVSRNAIELRWEPSEKAEAYKWERRRSNHQWIEKTGTVLADVTTYVNGYLRKNTTYCYDLMAVNAAGPSGATPEQCATTRW